jgi:hypothetical protein
LIAAKDQEVMQLKQGVVDRFFVVVASTDVGSEGGT